MKPSDVVPYLIHTCRQPVESRVLPLLISPPGHGKTQMVGQAAKALDGVLIDARPGTRDPIDLGGFQWPDAAAGCVRTLRPAIFPDPSDTRPTILLLDEIDKCAPANQNFLLGLCMEREVHGHRLGPNVSIVGAMNPAGTRSGGQQITSALQRRFVGINVDLDVPSVLNHAIDTAWDMRVVAYLQLCGVGTPSEPGQLSTFDPKVPGAYACPATWERVSDILKAGYPRHIESENIRGAIGQAANQFLAYLPMVDEMPNPMGVLMDPMGSEVPTKPGVLYGLMGALANLASDSNFQNVVAYTKRCPKPFAVFCILTAIRKNPAIKKCAAFVAWGVKNQDVLV